MGMQVHAHVHHTAVDTLVGSADIAETLERLEEVMDHWRDIMPGKILRVPYEHLVQDPEPTMRGVLDHCKMPWEPAVLDFHGNRRSVTTASLAQVLMCIRMHNVSKMRDLGVSVRGVQKIERAGHFL